MSAARPRVLVVDDSAFARKVLREVLSSDPRVEVVGIARDGLDALEKIAELDPDVVTLDLVMPGLDGIGVLRALREQGRGRPHVIVVSISDVASELGVAALEAGALDVVHKPTALATDRLYELRDEVVAKVLAAASAQTIRVVPSPPVAPAVAQGPGRDLRAGIVAIGASTGGPQAVTRVLEGLPATFPVPIAVVLHMPVGYTEAFASRIDGLVPLAVREARDEATIAPGEALIARAGLHLRIEIANGVARARLSSEPLGSLHRPSVDELFRSVARVYGPRALGVVLTGMGSDGLEGARAIRAAGGRVFVESGETCVVDGMPRSVREAGLASEVVPLPAMAAAIAGAV